MADTPNGKMTLGRLRVLLDSYGAAAGRWPAQERAAALALVASSDTARAAYNEAARLDARLDRMPEAEMSPALAEHIAALPLPPPLPLARTGLIARLARARTSAPRLVWQGAVAAATIIGLAVGMTLPALVLDPPARQAAMIAVIDTGDPAQDEEAELPDVAALGLTGDGDGDGARDILDIPVT